MTAHLISGATSQLFAASNLLGVLLLIAALAILRSKRTAQDICASLQLLVVGVLLYTFAEMLLLAQLVSQQLTLVIDLLGILIWLAGALSLAAASRSRLKIALTVTATLAPWLLAVAYGVTEALDLTSWHNRGFGLLPYSPSAASIALVGAIVASIISIRSVFVRRYHSIVFFLAGSVLIASSSLTIEALQLSAAQNAVLQNESLTLNLYLVAKLIAPALFCIGAVFLRPRLRLSLSRKLSFYAAMLGACAIFLVLVASANALPANPGNLFLSIFQLCVALLASAGLAYILLAPQIRNRIRVSIDKHFFQHKYDYRSVWLRLINTLSETAEDEHFFERGLKALANIVEADGGVLWLANNQQEYSVVAKWNMTGSIEETVDESEPFIEPFISEEWIYALSRSGKQEHDRHLRRLPDWLNELDDLWVVAPLTIGKRLLGFFVLIRQENNDALIWEDIDVLKSAGRQMASYIVRQQSAEELALSRQFDTYNKLTAFIMHDLKNLIAQQALVVENAKKHQENPAFVEDAIRTIDNSVKRMNQLLKRLQRSSHQNVQRTVAISEIITEAIQKSADRQPIPMLRRSETEAHVIADREQIVMILLHVIRNAQDATASSGFIDIEVQRKNTDVILTIEDNGCGMDENFIKNRLFKPFDSTKSSMGMGIGAYQVREFIESMGGTLNISSELNVGTIVSIQLPIHHTEKQQS